MRQRITALLLCLVILLTLIPTGVSAAETPLSITAQPQNGYAAEGETARASVTAEGDGLEYQWFVKTAGGKKFEKSSVTKAAYSFKMTAKASGRQVYCVVSDKYGNSQKSDTVTLKIPVPLKIVLQPGNAYAKNGERAVTSVSVQGDELQYQWYLKNPGQSKFYESSVDGPKYAITMSQKISGRQLY